MEAGLIDSAASKPLAVETEEIAKMLRGLIKHFEVRDDDGDAPRYS
jgi:hypothetical protein